jgi:hypothetical protein
VIEVVAKASYLLRTVLLTDRSGLRGDTRPVGDQGQKRLGSMDFCDLVHGGLLIAVMLASQAFKVGL